MAQSLFESLEASLQEAITYHRGKITLRTHRRYLKPAPAYTPQAIRRIRRRLRVSQGVFAAALNVSTGTVQSWEQGRRRPEGTALRLLEILVREPQAVLQSIKKRPAA